MAEEGRAKLDLEDDDASSGDDAGGKGTKRKDPGNDPEAEESKRAERRAANRRSAFQSRQRRKILIEDLQKTVATLSKENTDLRNNNNQLRAKLETAMLENQLLRKQKGGTAPTLEINGDSGVADGAAAGDSINAGPSTDEKIPAGATASAGTNNQTQGATVATASNAQTVDNAPAPPANNGVLGSNNQVGVPAAAALLALNGGGNTNGAPPSQLLGTQAPSTAAHLLSNQAVPAAQLMNGLHSLPGANPASDPLLAARLALAGASGGLGNLNNVGNPAVMPGASQQQPNHAVHALAVNPANLGLGGGQQLQQLAMLLGGAVARPADPGQQQFALLQAAFGRSIAAASAPTTAAPSDSMSQVMRALSENQASDQQNGAAPTT